jgi:CheY-like chemotaxis protein
MRKNVHFFPSDFTQPLVNWVLALRDFTGLASVFSNSSHKRNRGKSRINSKQFYDKDLLVWFIDDDPINNMLNRSLMEEYFSGVSIAIFQDPRNALSELGNAKMPAPDVIFLDLNMPGFNGWDFMDVFNATGYSSRIFILTSSIDPNDRSVANENSNVAGFYSKPLLPEMIQEALRRND